MARGFYGRVRGRTIELDEDPGVADGTEVEIHIQLRPGKTPLVPEVNEKLTQAYAARGQRRGSVPPDIANRED